jgi:hypothetical protein
LTTITEKQIKTRRVVQTLYIPLQIAIKIDTEAKRLGLSRSTLITHFIAEGLNNNNLPGLQKVSSPETSQAALTAPTIQKEVNS